MIVRASVRQSQRLFNQLVQYLADFYGLSLEEAREDPHVLSFLERLVERPRRWTPRGQCLEGPIRAKLVEYIVGLRGFLRDQAAPLQLTERSLQFAKTLQARYSTPFKGARAVLDDSVEQLVRSLNDAKPTQLRLKAATLLIRNSGARPSEILYRRYPDDVNADYRGGIVITVATSKTSPSKPEYLNFRHDPNPVLCGICALRQWLDWLGPGYRGPLFPTIGRNNRVRTTSLSRTCFTIQLNRRFAVAGIAASRLTAYSLRKGAATQAAARGIPLREIQRRLRHRNVLQSVAYIDAPVLFQLVRSTVE